MPDGKSSKPVPIPPVPDRATLLRADDLVAVEVGVAGFDWLVDAKGAPVRAADGALQLNPAGPDATVYVVLAPQSVGERARLESSPASVLDDLRLARMSGASVLVLRAEPGDPPIPWTSAGLLAALSTLTLVLPPGARQAVAKLGGRAQPAADQPAVAAGAAGRLEALRAAGGGNRSAGAAPRLWTMLEVPYRLVVSFTGGSSLIARADALTVTADEPADAPPPGMPVPAPLAAGGGHSRSDLWHGRLLGPGAEARLRGDDDGLSFGEVAAIGVDDWQDDPSHQVFQAPLDPAHRDEIARAAQVRPIPVRRLMVSALGAWLDVATSWGPGELGRDNPLALWRHRMTAGRDQHVEVADYGYTYPFGHSALLLSVTNRELDGDAFVLYKRYFVVVLTPVLTYTDRDFPYTEVRLCTLVTPSLSPEPAPDAKVVLPQVNGVPVQFAIQAKDHQHTERAFTSPLVWVSSAGGPGDVAAAATQYAALGAVNVHGQRIAYAEQDAPDDTRLTSERLTFAHADVAPSATAAPFRPVLAEALVRPPGIAALTGSDAPVAMRYHGSYLASGDPGILLEVTDPTTAPAVLWGGSGGRSGGLIQPDGAIVGFGRGVGPVLGSAQVLSGTVNGSTVFGALPSALLLGAVPLANLLPGGTLDSLVPKVLEQALTVVELLETTTTAVQQAAASGAPALADVAARAQAAAGALAAPGPGLAAALTAVASSISAARGALPAITDQGTLQRATAALEALDQALQAIGPADQIAKAIAAGLPASSGVVTLDYAPPLQTSAPVEVDPGGGLHLHAELRHSGPQGTGADVSCVLQGIGLNLANLFTLKIPRVSIQLHDGHKPDVDADVGNPAFTGALAFIQTLYDLLPAGGFGDPPAVTADATGIHAGYDFAVPAIAVGVFSLENLGVAAGLLVPFVGDPMELDVSISSRDKPFLMTVMAIGGGGWAVVALGPKGLVGVEVGLEFGAAIEIDLGVASGGVSVAAGIYIVLDGSGASLSGFFRIRGQVDVLGLVSASLELTLTLHYDTGQGKVWGEATLTICIHICFFSTSVSVGCRRTFASGSGDPTLAESMTSTHALGAGPPGPATGKAGKRRGGKAGGRGSTAAAPAAWVTYCEAFADD